ncbi:MAG TPA: hypothetical protein VFT67_02140 [Jatrophihabitantaceae bacterium]|nr:hypothetical protein [Jatrophihabitantaceae bacterium]
MITDPRFAPRREDLPYLRRRHRPRQVEQPVDAAPSPPKISFDRPERAPAPRVEAPAPAAPPPPAPPPAPMPPPVPPAPVSTSLDLDAPAPVAPAASSAPRAPERPRAPRVEPRRRVRDDVRVAAGRRVILTVSDPTVTLTRLQSAIGTLRFEAAVSAEVGDLQLGCAYRLRSGLSSVLAPDGDHRLAPPGSRRPVLLSGHDEFGTVEVDLRQSRDLDRLALYAYSASRTRLRWGGTLVVETFGKARIELPLESLQGGDLAVLMSLYNVRGEFVLRAEMQTLNGDVREACRAYGYDRITWLDGRNPVD